MPKAIWIFLFLAEMDFVSLRSSSVYWNFRIKKSTIWRKCYKNG